MIDSSFFDTKIITFHSHIPRTDLTLSKNAAGVGSLHLSTSDVKTLQIKRTPAPLKEQMGATAFTKMRTSISRLIWEVI